MESYLMQQNARFTVSTVSVLFRENKQAVNLPYLSNPDQG